MRLYRLLLVLTLLGVPAWAQPVLQQPVDAAEHPVEGGADTVDGQVAPDAVAQQADEAPVGPSPEDATVVDSPVEAGKAEAIDEEPVAQEAMPTEASVGEEVGDESPAESPAAEAPPMEPSSVVEEERPPARRVRAVAAEPSPEAPAVVVSPAPARRSEPLNELALVAGWNAPSGWGGRYLRRIPNTQVALGAGLAPLTMWGLKLSLIARRAPDFHRGLFQQVSVGFSTGAEQVDEVLVDEAGSRDISLRKTPGRTLDLVVGYRWPVFTRSFAELFTGWSFNVQGTFLQNAEASRVPVPQALREELELQTPGGLILGLTFGWRF